PPPGVEPLFPLPPPFPGAGEVPLPGEVLVGDGELPVGLGDGDGDGLEGSLSGDVEVVCGSSGSSSSGAGSFSVVSSSVTMDGSVDVVGSAAVSSPLNMVAA